MAAEINVTYARPDDLHDTGRRAFYLSLLSEGEHARFVRLRSEPKRDLFLAAHALARLSLSRCADVDPAAWKFSPGPGGRPSISAPKTDLVFTLSHTRDLACCAVTHGEGVGIDVEDVSYPRSAGLAERLFSARECADLCSVPDAERPERFFEYWTLKEAYVKALGGGLSLALDAFSFYRDRDNQWRVECDPDVDADPGRWSFRSWRVGARHQVALAVSAISAAHRRHAGSHP